MVEPLRFIVLQTGARLHYAVPTLLAKAGMLEWLYTDVYVPSGPVSRLFGNIPSRMVPPAVTRLAGRTVPSELQGRVRSAPIAAFRDWLAAHGFPKRAASRTARTILQNRILKSGFKGANALYTLGNGDLELVKAAKRRGVFVVHEQIINPHVGRILHEERERLPGVEPQDSLEEVERGISRDEEQWKLADLVVGGSDFVRSEVLEHGIPAERVATVPYGIPATWLSEQSEPQRGRILFVGSVGLRKGVHYLAAASQLLKKRGVTHDVRVVGPFEPSVVSRPEFAGLNYIGQVPRTRVREEFRAADVFVLPTLAEGCALVHLEALAYGLPVITTPNCGSVVRDGIDGWIVPIRDATTLADRIQQLLEDRELRQRMSLSARERAAEFVWDRYAPRLLAAISDAARLSQTAT